MGFTVDWIDEARTILCYTVEGKWTWEQFYSARDRARQLADAAEAGLIDTIIDIRNGSLMPNSALTHFRNLSQHSHTRIGVGTAVIVGDNLFVKSMMTVMRTVNGKRMEKFHIAATIEDALALLARQR